jgi:hypothetical protein
LFWDTTGDKGALAMIERKEYLDRLIGYRDN